MPYYIRKAPRRDEYKVYSKRSGRALSNKWLTLDQAKKQLIAVSLSEGIFPRKKKWIFIWNLQIKRMENVDTIDSTHIVSASGKKWTRRK